MSNHPLRGFRIDALPVDGVGHSFFKKRSLNCTTIPLSCSCSPMAPRGSWPCRILSVNSDASFPLMKNWNRHLN